MARPRSTINELLRLFDALAAPLYVVDARRRVVAVNAACAAWAGHPAESLAGQECRFHNSAEVEGPSAVAAALCPPTEAFQGQRVARSVVLSGAGGQPQTWVVQFVPLLGEDGSVLAVLGSGTSQHSAEEDDATETQLAVDATSLQLHQRLQRWRWGQGRRYHVDRLLGDTPVMQRVRAQVMMAAGTTATVSIVGPAGSGRHHAARAIHYGTQPLQAGALVPLVCRMLTAELLQGTIRTLVRGRVEPAPSAAGDERTATLLLDDVDQLPAEAQVELEGLLSLAALPLRVITVSSAPLESYAASGLLRPGLACLLSTMTIEMPPLAARRGDVPLLAQALLEECNRRSNRQREGFTPEALDRLAAYDWPGQVRELAECVAAAHAAAEHVDITPSDLPPRLARAAAAARHPRRAESTIVLSEFLEQIERELIERALRQAKGNRTRTARLLGLSRPRLLRRMAHLGIEQPARQSQPGGAGGDEES